MIKNNNYNNNNLKKLNFPQIIKKRTQNLINCK